VHTRVEPKTFFANERTFLQWLQIRWGCGGCRSGGEEGAFCGVSCEVGGPTSAPACSRCRSGGEKGRGGAQGCLWDGRANERTFLERTFLQWLQIRWAPLVGWDGWQAAQPPPGCRRLVQQFDKVVLSSAMPGVLIHLYAQRLSRARSGASFHSLTFFFLSCCRVLILMTSTSMLSGTPGSLIWAAIITLAVPLLCCCSVLILMTSTSMLSGTGLLSGLTGSGGTASSACDPSDKACFASKVGRELCCCTRCARREGIQAAGQGRCGQGQCEQGPSGQQLYKVSNPAHNETSPLSCRVPSSLRWG